jgi:hypothetical protein
MMTGQIKTFIGPLMEFKALMAIQTGLNQLARNNLGQIIALGVIFWVLETQIIL